MRNVGVVAGVLSIVVAAIAGSSAPPPAATAAPTPLQAELDAALAKGRKDTGAPAATGAVIRCGELLWSGADGVLDTDSGRPATTHTRFVLASTTKPVIASIVLGLVERRKLSLRTRLARFYPRLPKARKITVRMLLDHTSGLNDYFDDSRINRVIAEEPAHHWTRGEVLRGITRTLFKPGSRFSYSNSGYIVLGGIVEKRTGKPIEEVFRSRIAGPLQLGDSSFEYQPERSDLFAHPYARANGALRDRFVPGTGIAADYWGPVWTDGGLASTAEDLARFGDGLFEGRLVRLSTVRTMTRLNRFGDGLGLFPLKVGGHLWLGHNGAYDGFESEVWHDAKRRLTITVTTNSDDSSGITWLNLVNAYDRVAPSEPPCPALH